MLSYVPFKMNKYSRNSPLIYPRHPERTLWMESPKSKVQQEKLKRKITEIMATNGRALVSVYLDVVSTWYQWLGAGPWWVSRAFCSRGIIKVAWPGGWSGRGAEGRPLCLWFQPSACLRIHPPANEIIAGRAKDILWELIPFMPKATRKCLNGTCTSVDVRFTIRL